MSRDDEFNQFLGAMALGADGSSRKPASPVVLSPLPPPPPTGETIFKKRNRHVKMSSQPVKIDTAELQREYAKAANMKSRQASDEERTNGSGDKTQPIEEEEAKRKGVGMSSFTKRLQKISLVRGVSASTDKAASSPRPRSPSKDAMGTIMRLGNRSAIVSKLGFGLSRRDSEERDESNESQPQQPLQQPSPMSMMPSASTNAVPVMSLPPGTTINSMRRSSAPTYTVALDVQNISGVSDSALEAEIDEKRRERRSSGLKTNSDKGRPGFLEIPKDRAPFATTDLSPVFLQQKNNSSSSMTDMGAPPPQVGNKRMDLEVARWKDDHAALEAGMAKTVKGALVLAKSADTRTKRKSMEDNATDALRIAALTLQANNDLRLRELSEKVQSYERKAHQISEHASRIRDDLLTECRLLYDMAEKFEIGANAERENFKQKEVSYRTANTKSENELKMLNEKVSDVLHLKEKSFKDLINDAESRLRNLAIGGVAQTSGTWSSLLDHSFHSFVEIVLLGGGTLLSLISSIVVLVMSFMPCIRSSRRPLPPKNRRSYTT